MLKFQFPSNGKVDPKTLTIGMDEVPAEVSIPFKRESRSKGPEKAKDLINIFKFQFPSNGKVDPKRPYFKPSGAVGPEAQKYTRTAQGIFFIKI